MIQIIIISIFGVSFLVMMGFWMYYTESRTAKV